MRMKVSSPTSITSLLKSWLWVSAKYMMMSLSGSPCSSMGTKDSPKEDTVMAATSPASGSMPTQRAITWNTASLSTRGSRLVFPAGLGYSR